MKIIEKEIEKLVSLIWLSTFSFSLDQSDWISIAKIFFKLIGKLYERNQLERRPEFDEI